MKKRIKKITFIGFIIFLLLQCYQPARNVSNEQVSSNNFTEVYKVPKNIETTLKTSCYDCHSNNTQYLWYDYIQPARMFVESHIKNGKKELNFYDFGSYSNRRKQSKLQAIKKQIQSGDMPLSSYTALHPNANLNESQKQELIDWIESIQQNSN